jgi:hypothetical protein
MPRYGPFVRTGRPSGIFGGLSPLPSSQANTRAPLPSSNVATLPTRYGQPNQEISYQDPQAYNYAASPQTIRPETDKKTRVRKGTTDSGYQHPSLEADLAEYDRLANEWYLQARIAYQNQQQLQSAAQQGQIMANLEQTYSRGTGGEFGGGERLQAEVMAGRALSQQEMQNVGAFDVEIQKMIGATRDEIATGHYDYTRQMSLQEQSYEWQMKIAQYQMAMYQDIATQQAWVEALSNFGAIGGIVPLL